MRVALFVTCVNDTLTPAAGVATVTLLERLGIDVDFPAAQTCCGQMHANSGYEREALPPARRFAAIFGDPAYEAIVCPSSSCVAMVRHRYRRLAEAAGDADLADRVAEIGARTYDLSEFLVDRLGVVDVGATYAHRVAYHPSCHGLRELRLGDGPLRLLRAVARIELVDLPRAESCCGFGGTFAVKNADVSAAMLTDKLTDLAAAGAEVCTATDSSCLLQIGGGLSRRRAGMRVAHIAEILASER